MKRFKSTKAFLLLLVVLCGQFAYANDTVPEAPIPEEVREWMHAERFLNDRENDERAFKAIDIEADPEFAPYDPVNDAKFQVGYYDVPADELDYLESDSLSPKAKKFFFVKKGGKKYVRYFVHPDMEKHPKIRANIKAYGEVINGKPSLTFSGYVAAPTSSPRSLLVWHMDKPSEFFGMKVSLSRVIGGTSRLNDKDKLVRASVSSEVLDNIPAKVKKELMFDHYRESLQIGTPGAGFGTIIREFDDAFTGPKDQIPGFSLTAKPKEAGAMPFLFNELKGVPKKQRYQHVLDNVLKPLMQMYSYQVWVEGMLGEQHQQNVTLGITNGKLDGTVRVKDMDAYRIDPELRTFTNRPMESFTSVTFKPQEYLKYGKSVKKDADGTLFIQNSYNNFIRNNWSFLIDNFFERYGDKLGIDWEGELDGGKKIWRDVDKLFLSESLKYMDADTLLGFAQLNFVEGHLDELQRLLPERNWSEALEKAKAGEEVLSYTDDEARKIIQNFELYKILNYVDEGNYRFPLFLVTDIYTRYKTKLKDAHVNLAESAADQKFLAKQYFRLIDNYRTMKKSSRLAETLDLEYVLGDGVILVYNKKKNMELHDIATLEPKNVDKSFYAADVAKGRPRALPTAAELKKLNNMRRSLKSSNGCGDLMRALLR
ncbi:MAG: hypothetical protein NXH75_11875 [Halobacteriovoraceae bacterium]|nr:hypothetical protein [Halobacteriovoraceae bacterium]